MRLCFSLVLFKYKLSWDFSNKIGLNVFLNFISIKYPRERLRQPSILCGVLFEAGPPSRCSSGGLFRTVRGGPVRWQEAREVTPFDFRGWFVDVIFLGGRYSFLF